MELGYHVTLVRDGTAARSPEAMHAAMDIDGPTYAHAGCRAEEIIYGLEGKLTPTLMQGASIPV